MLHNDLTNDVWRSLVVFDGFLGRPIAPTPPAAPATGITVSWVRRCVEFMRLRPTLPIEWSIDPLAVRYVNAIPSRTDTSVEIVTFAGRDRLEEIERLLDEHTVLYQELHAWTLDELARRCGWDVSIFRVYHNDRDHWLAYGTRGHYVGDL